MDRFTPTIPPQYVVTSLQFPLYKGATLDQIAKASSVNLDDLQNRTKYFSLDEVMRMIKACTEMFDMPHYGLMNGNHVQLTCHGLAGVSMLHQTNYSRYLQVCSRLGNHLFPPLEIEYFETQNQVGIRLYECISLAPYTRYFMEWIMAHVRTMFRFLIGTEYKPDYIAFPYSKPTYIQHYESLLSCALKFNVEHAEFVVNKHLATRELPLANNTISVQAEKKFMQTACNEESEVTREVRALLARNLHSVLSLEEVAEQLEMSSRTLRRNLKKQATSYIEIVEDLRREVAISQLLNSNKSITDIAVSLDFYDTASFSRAFKRWTGQSPKAFRSALNG